MKIDEVEVTTSITLTEIIRKYFEDDKRFSEIRDVQVNPNGTITFSANKGKS